MTSFRVERLPFSRNAVDAWSTADGRHVNWPVVYTLTGERSVYVGETVNAVVRMRQHLDPASGKDGLNTIRIVIDEEFNKSACLDLESYLIRLFAGDGRYAVMNRNEGITNADYYDRARYRRTFDEIFEALRSAGMFTRDIAAIENSDLFKLSPFKALNQEQAVAIEGILEGLFEDLAEERMSTIVVQGEPGTGKTIVGIFLMKLLRDIQLANPHQRPDADSLFSEFFAEGYPEMLTDFRMGMVVPQQSLRESIKRVFSKTPGLGKALVVTPFQVGADEHDYDLLIVDETHRLTQRANQPSGPLNKKFAEITRRIFGGDDLRKTQLDWIRAKSRHQIFLVDSAQSVRPADLPQELLRDLISEARGEHRHYLLASQMRVLGGNDYIAYVRRLLDNELTEPREFGDYEFRLFDDLSAMQAAIRNRDEEYGLARLTAGYAWPWKTKKHPEAFDIEVDGCHLRWNQVAVDWINSPGSIDEVGSIHTVQGYDLNYAGVIIGQDLRYDPVRKRLFIDRNSYHDKKGKENNPTLGIKYSDDDLLRYITNVYAVLMTRGMRGTYVYACDPGLREYLRAFMVSHSPHE